jgi:N-acetylneuraminic acid mutarotase
MSTMDSLFRSRLFVLLVLFVGIPLTLSTLTPMVSYASNGDVTTCSTVQPLSTYLYNYNVVSASFGSDGSRLPGAGSFTPVSSLPVSLQSHRAVAVNGRIYVVGGYSSTGTQSKVYMAISNPDGSLGQWQETSPLPEGRYWFGLTEARGWLYAIGGGPDNLATTVRCAPINGDGTLGTWTSSLNLPAPVWGPAATSYNNYIYVVGGATPGPSHPSLKTVYYAAVNADGSLTTWLTTSSLNLARESLTAVAYGGYLFAFGGYDNQVNDSQDVWHTAVEGAVINGDGSLGSWGIVNNLTVPQAYLTSAVAGDSVYAIGGMSSNSSMLSSVECAQFGSGGSLNAWTSTSSLPGPRTNAGAAAVGTYIYIIGGIDSNTGGPVSNVYVAKIE